MIHNNEVLDKAIGVAAGFTDRYADLELYIVQNVYGKVMIYADTDKKLLVDDIEKELQNTIGAWLNTCESLEDNIFAASEIGNWKQESTPVRERIWVFEKYITNVYWDTKKREKQNLSCTVN